jgi:hypothetical protein
MSTEPEKVFEDPFDPTVIARKTLAVNEGLDAIELSETDKGLREWIPTFYTYPLEHLAALDFLLRRARGEITPRQQPVTLSK